MENLIDCISIDSKRENYKWDSKYGVKCDSRTMHSIQSIEHTMPATQMWLNATPIRSISELVLLVLLVLAQNSHLLRCIFFLKHSNCRPFLQNDTCAKIWNKPKIIMIRLNTKFDATETCDGKYETRTQSNSYS